MQIVKNKHNRRKYIIGGVLLLIVLGAVSYFIFIQRYDNSQDVSDPTSQASKDDKRDASQNESIPTNTTSGEKELPPQKSPSTSDQNSPNSTSSTPIELTIQNNLDEVVILSKIPNPTLGECTLTIRNNAKELVFNASAEIIYQDTYSSCAGFSIPKQQLPSGTMTAEIVTKNSTGKAILQL